ncbi:MAG: TraR/DksA family transcriptional regulator [Acidobacteria bacterium]|nr:TraR/DksA family transcriptional regulator [Acidobacteriota bacterium]
MNAARRNHNHTAPRSLAATKLNYGELLHSARQDALRELGLQHNNVATSDRVADDDLAMVNHDQFISGRLNKLDYDRLRLINEAIDRVNAGDYGTCLRCEEPIPQRRLEVIPWAKFCVSCQERVARREQEEENEEMLAHSVW